MPGRSLFPPERRVGIFRGFSEGGLEFHADIILPYRHHFQSMPMHGQFVLVQLASDEEAVLGRITSLFAEGRLTSPAGEDFGLRLIAEDRPMPEDLREQYLKYRVGVRVLGVFRRSAADGSFVFAPSHRRLPHVGSPVSFPDDEVLREIAGHNGEGADLGFLALGEFVYAAGDPRLRVKPTENWIQVASPAIVVKFPVESLVARRTFIFARAGFGKSNLVKLLFSNLYRETPTVEKRQRRQVPVGTLIFDPDGEYFWPDDKNRPGLCDVPHLQDKLVVFTNRKPPSPFYGSFVAGGVRLDLRRFKPADVTSIVLSPERQEQQNVRKLDGLPPDRWADLIDLIEEEGNRANLQRVKELLGLTGSTGEVEAVAARSNMTYIVRLLHERSSITLDLLLMALREGKLCVFDLSQQRGRAGLALTGLLLRRIFELNQEGFTEAEPRTLPTLAVLEEAQSVLGQGHEAADTPYVAWVKEGRKYDLGAVLITQQPGSLSHELLSQGDNWFLFHLLSAGDLQAARKANAHFSEDLLSTLLNEPLPGHAIFWSSVAGRPYPVPVRILSFEDAYRPLDPHYRGEAVPTYARRLVEHVREVLRGGSCGPASSLNGQRRGKTGDVQVGDGQVIAPQGDGGSHHPSTSAPPAGVGYTPADQLRAWQRRVVEALRSDTAFLRDMESGGLPWGAVKGRIKELLPPQFADVDDLAYRLVKWSLDELFGPEGWRSERRPNRQGKLVTWVVLQPSTEAAKEEPWEDEEQEGEEHRL